MLLWGDIHIMIGRSTLSVHFKMNATCWSAVLVFPTFDVNLASCTVLLRYLLICRLVRDAHRKGANIILIQVFAYEAWDMYLFFACRITLLNTPLRLCGDFGVFIGIFVLLGSTWNLNLEPPIAHLVPLSLEPGLP